MPPIRRNMLRNEDQERIVQQQLRNMPQVGAPKTDWVPDDEPLTTAAIRKMPRDQILARKSEIQAFIENDYAPGFYGDYTEGDR